jgi:hypothetical protein
VIIAIFINANYGPTSSSTTAFVLARLGKPKCPNDSVSPEHYIQILTAAGKLTPLGDPAPNAPKCFAAVGGSSRIPLFEGSPKAGRKLSFAEVATPGTSHLAVTMQ